MNSMTGFGRGSASDELLEVSIEVSSVNKRNLDFGVSLPREWSSLEPIIVEQLKKVASRGRVSVSLNVNLLASGKGVEWDSEAIGQTIKNLKGLAEEHVIDCEVNGDILLRIAAMHGKTPSLPPADDVKALVLKALGAALDQFAASRKAEGVALAKDLSKRAQQVIDSCEAIKKLSKNTVPNYRELLMQRLKNAGLELELQDERVLKEIAIFADRIDTAEELTRLSSHLKQLKLDLETEGVIGRKLEFIIQEILRELNTTGAKANNYEVSKIVVECKNELERIREQALNLE